MSTFRKNIRIGTKDPLWGRDDIARDAITTEKIKDKAVTEQKLADELKEWIIGGAGISDAPKTGDQYARKDGAWEKVDGLTEEQKQLLIDLDNEVFKLSAAYTSNNAGTFETGSSVTPTASFKIERHGRDVASEAVVTASGTTVATDKKSWTAPSISSGSKTYATSVTQGGQTVNLGNLTWYFSFYRYRGEVADIPSDYPAAIKALTTQELSTATTLGSTALSANKYYLFAVRIPDERLPRFVVRHAQTGGEISGIVTGVYQVARKNGTGNEYYAYVLVPKSSSSWNFTISNS